MKFKIVNEYENPLLERRQFTVEITEANVTPKRIDVVKQFSAKQGLNIKTLIVDTIYSDFGSTVFKAYIKSYKDEKSLQKVEVKNNVEKWKKIMQELYPAEKPKEESAEKTE